MFEAFKTKASNLGQKVLVKMGQAEEFKEDEEFNRVIENFKATRLALLDILSKGKAYIESCTAMTASKLAFVWPLFSPFFF